MPGIFGGKKRHQTGGSEETDRGCKESIGQGRELEQCESGRRAWGTRLEKITWKVKAVRTAKMSMVTKAAIRTLLMPLSACSVPTAQKILPPTSIGMVTRGISESGMAPLASPLGLTRGSHIVTTHEVATDMPMLIVHALSRYMLMGYELL